LFSDNGHGSFDSLVLFSVAPYRFLRADFYLEAKASIEQMSLKYRSEHEIMKYEWLYSAKNTRP
jgi:hypothetical protein